MKKNIKVKSKTDWTKIKDMINDFHVFREKYDQARIERPEEFNGDKEDLSRYIRRFTDTTLELEDFDVPLSEITDGFMKDVTMKATVLEAVQDYDPYKVEWACNNLGRIIARYDPVSDEIDVCIDFKPKLGFAASMAAKGIFMAFPEEKLQESVQEFIDDADENGWELDCD